MLIFLCVLRVYTCRYPRLLTKSQAKLFKEPFPHGDSFCATWRGGGFRDECRHFFESMLGRQYRVPGFVATSLNKKTALGFLSRANMARPRILWCILVRDLDSSFHPCIHPFALRVACEYYRSSVPIQCVLLSTHCACSSCSSTRAVEAKENSDASMRASLIKLKLRTRWNISSRRTQCLR